MWPTSTWFVYTSRSTRTFVLSDLHLLVLIIHRAVCKPCGHCCRFFFRFHTRNRVSCWLHTLNSVLNYPQSQLSFSHELVCKFPCWVFKPNIQLALSLYLLVRLFDYSVFIRTTLCHEQTCSSRLSHFTATHKQSRSRLLDLRSSLEWI